jgi:hypothetical protein
MSRCVRTQSLRPATYYFLVFYYYAGLMTGASRVRTHTRSTPILGAVLIKEYKDIRNLSAPELEIAARGSSFLPSFISLLAKTGHCPLRSSSS